MLTHIENVIWPLQWQTTSEMLQTLCGIHTWFLSGYSAEWEIEL